ncbi:MAG: hypothetical protein HOL70_03110 [Candidatus Marinimicrobia bacterium]|jgi:hypothetical protein|nr:hypothetical protein [Candidatus Neomarinimicrobiota bacterium]
MHFIEISGTKYGGGELSDMTANNLISLGIESFQSINIDPKNNTIHIGFENVEDANVAHAIAGIKPRLKSKTFCCQDARQFLLELYSVANSWSGDQ